MRMAKEASMRPPTWFTAPDHDANSMGRRPAGRRRPEDGPTSFRAIVVSSAFLVVFSVALMIGGHAAIDPLMRSAIAARETKDLGDVVVTMADGKFCRHMSFDNATAEIVEGKVGPCPDNITRGQFRAYRGFAWGSGSGTEVQP